MAAKNPLDDAAHLRVGIAAQRLQQRPQGEPARRGSGEHDAPPNIRIGVGDPPADVGLEPRRVSFQQPAERLVGRGANVRIFSGGKGPDGIKRVVSPPAATAEPEEQLHLILWVLCRRQCRDQIVRRGLRGLRRRHRCWSCRLPELLAQGGLAAFSQGVVSFEVEDRAAQAGDELGKIEGFGVAGAHSALPLDHPCEQRLAGCHQLVHASPQLRGCLFAGGDALPGPGHFPSEAHQLLRVALTFRLEEMSLELGAQRLGVLQSPVHRGDFRTGAGDLVLNRAQALGFTGLTGRSLGETDAGLIGFGARLVERAAQLLEPTLEQQGPVRAPRASRAAPGWRATTRGRYAFSQGKRTMRHYSEMREFAKPGSLVWGVGVGAPADTPPPPTPHSY